MASGGELHPRSDAQPKVRPHTLALRSQFAHSRSVNSRLDARPVAVVALALALASCAVNDGRIDVALVTAPQSDIAARAETLTIWVSSPPTEVTTTRSAGFALSLAVPGEGQLATVAAVVRDANGALIAWGQTPPFVLGPINASVRIFVAPPMSLEPAPAQLSAPRTQLGVAALSLGALFAGGSDATNAPRSEVEVYNAFTHEVALGLNLPQARRAPAVAYRAGSAVYVAGGTTTVSDEPNLASWRFDTAVAPAGQYQTLRDTAGLRAGPRIALPLASRIDAFALLGNPAALLDGTTGTVTPLAGRWPAVGAPLVVDAGAQTWVGGVVVGVEQAAPVAATLTMNAAGAVTVTPFAGPPTLARSEHAVVAAGATAFVVAGQHAAEPRAAPTNIVKMQFAVGAGALMPSAMTEMPNVLQTGRVASAAAVTADGRYLLVAGGVTPEGAALPNAEVIDAETLQPLAGLPWLAGHRDAVAVALPNGAVLLAGGRGADGVPSALLWLFTPAVPAHLQVLGATD